MSEQTTQRVPNSQNSLNRSLFTAPSPTKRTPSVPVYIPRDEEKDKAKPTPSIDHVINKSSEQVPASQRSSENVRHQLSPLEQQRKQLMLQLEAKNEEIKRMVTVDAAHRERVGELEALIKETNKQHQALLEAKDSKINNMTNETEALKQKTQLETHDLIIQMQELNAKITELQNQRSDQFAVTEQVKQQFETAAGENLQMKRAVQETANELSETKIRLEKTMNEHKRIAEECNVLQQQVSELQKYKIENENTLKVKIQPKSVYIRRIPPSGMSRSLVDILMTAFVKLLKKRMALVEMNLEVKICTDMPENTDAPFFVLEVVKTKIENDIDNVLIDKEVSKVTGLVLFHGTKKEEVGMMTQTRPRRQDIRCIVDMAYTTKDGIFTCDWNNKAFETVINKIIHFVNHT